jgi:hypothetical protein
VIGRANASDHVSCEVGGDDSGEDYAIKGSGASDAGDSGLKCFDVAKVKQIRADEGTQHSRYKGGLWRLFGDQPKGAYGCDRSRHQSRQGDADP